MSNAAARLRALLDRPGILLMPGCHDAISARLIEEAGFEIGFMSGFAVSADRLGMPDTGLISYAELVDQGHNICHAVSIPMIGDGDTGFGSAQNIKRTVQGYRAAGFASIMLEDQRRNDAAIPKARRLSVETKRSCACAPRWTRAMMPARTF